MRNYSIARGIALLDHCSIMIGIGSEVLYEKQSLYLVGFLVYLPLYFWDGFKMMTQENGFKPGKSIAMIERIVQFDSYATHSMLGKRYAEIKKAGEIETAHIFIMAWAELSIDEFAEKVVRMSIMPNRPKSWQAMEELLICTCSALRGKVK